jgi:hypothetical protein
MNNITTQRTQAAQDESTVTSGYRDLFGLLAAVGACLCVTPAFVIGIGMAIAFGILWLFMPAVEEAEQDCIEETRQSGDGAGAFWRTVGIMLIVGFFAVLFGGGAMMAMLGDA